MQAISAQGNTTGQRREFGFPYVDIQVIREITASARLGPRL